MPLIDHFGLIAPFYDRLAGLPDPQEWLEPAALPAEGALLDVGGGTGRYAAALKPHVGMAVVADISIQMLSQVARKAGLAPVCAGSEALPFAARSFERIIMVDALHHVIDQPATAAEMWRLLKPGGRLVIVEPDRENWAVKIVLMAEKLMLMRSHFLRISEIAALFDRPGASVRLLKRRHSGWVMVDKNNENA